MSLPTNQLSISEKPSTLLIPPPSSPYTDFAVTKDKRVLKAVWKNGVVTITHNDVIQGTVSIPNADRIAFALDVNDFYVIAVQHSSGNYVKHNNNTYALESGISDVVANIDYASHLPATTDFRDVVVSYIKNNKLWCVYQRFNYSSPIELRNNVVGLRYMCPNQEYRLQFGARFVPSLDPYAGNVVSLLHFEETDGSVTTADVVSPVKVNWTNYGGIYVSRNRSKAGLGSLYKSGGARFNGLMTTAITTSVDWCYEISVNFAAITGTSKFTTPPTGFDVEVTSGGIIRLVNYFSAVLLTCTNSPITTNTWYDIAVEKTGGLAEIVTVYLNGNPIGSTALVGYTTWGVGSQIYLVGGTNNGDIQHAAYYDEFRLSTIARYNGSYSPSAAPFPNP